MKSKLYSSSNIIKISIFCVSFVSLLFSQNLASAAVNKLPAPTIGTLLGFYPNGKYSAISSGGNSSLGAGESIVNYSLSVVILDAGESIGAPCGTAGNGTVIANAFGASTPQNSGQFLPLLATWTNPANSEFRIICAYSDYKIKNAEGVRSSLASPVSYATILPTPSPSLSPTISPSPSPSPSSTVVAEVMKPSGSKPSVSGIPIEGSKFKVSIKAWNMNGNDFEGRSVYLKLCGDSNCNDVINSYPVVETGTLNFDVAKTLTMPKVVGKAGQYVKVVDSVSYPALASGELREDLLVELSSSIKKIEGKSVASASPSPTELSISPEDSTTATAESVSVESDTNATESSQDTKSLSRNMIIVIFGSITAILLIVLLTILIKRKK
jgi:hypothetical protein